MFYSTNTMLVRSIVSSKSVHSFLSKVHPLHAFWGSGHRCRSYCTSEVAKEIKKDQPQSIKQHVTQDIVDVWICKPDRVQLLADELKSLHKTNARSEDSAPIKVGGGKNWIESTLQKNVANEKVINKIRKQAIWPQQVLPNCSRIQGTTLQQLVDPSVSAAIYHLRKGLQEGGPDFKWNLFTSVGDYKLTPKLHRIERFVLDKLKYSWKKLYKHYSPEIGNGSTVIQLFMPGPEKLYFSASNLSFSTSYGWDRPLPWVNGRCKIVRDKNAPSRAYTKLEEILQLLYDPINKTHVLPPSATCIELGAAPGSWTNKLLERGYKMITIDRAKLTPKHANHIQHIVANGTVYRPANPAYCVLCDMTLPAKKSYKVLLRWVKERSAKMFIWTFKFVGATEYQSLYQFREELEKEGCELTIRHLYWHGNEVVFIGRIPDTPPTATPPKDKKDKEQIEKEKKEKQEKKQEKKQAKKEKKQVKKEKIKKVKAEKSTAKNPNQQKKEKTFT